MGASSSVQTNKEKQIQEDLEIEEIINRVRKRHNEEDDIVLGKTTNKQSINTNKHKRYANKNEVEPVLEAIDEKHDSNKKRQKRYQRRETILNEDEDILDNSHNKHGSFNRSNRPSSFRKTRENTRLPHVQNSSRPHLLSPEPEMIIRERSSVSSPNRDANTSPFQRSESIIPEEIEDDSLTGWDGKPRLKSSRGLLLLKWLAQSNSNAGYDEDLHININEEDILPELTHSASEPALSGRQNSFIMHKARFTSRREKSFTVGPNKRSKHPSLLEREPTEVSILESPRLPVITENRKYLSQGLQALHNKEHIKQKSQRFDSYIKQESHTDEDSNNNTYVTNQHQPKRNESACSDPISRGNSVLNSRTGSYRYGRSRNVSVSSDPLSRSSSFMSNTRLVSAKFQDRDSGIESKFSDYGDIDSVHQNRREKDAKGVSKVQIHRIPSAKTKNSASRPITEQEIHVTKRENNARKVISHQESVKNIDDNKTPSKSPVREKTKDHIKTPCNSIKPNTDISTPRLKLNKDQQNVRTSINTNTSSRHKPNTGVKNDNDTGPTSHVSKQLKHSGTCKSQVENPSSEKNNLKQERYNADKQEDEDDSESDTESDDTDGAQSEANDEIETNTDTTDLTQAEIELYEKIKSMRMQRDLTKNEFGDIMQGYLSKKKDEILSEEKDKPKIDKEEEETKKAAELLVQNLHKDKMQINDLREAERNKLQDKLKRRLQVKKQIKQMVANCLKTDESKNDEDPNDNVIDT